MNPKTREQAFRFLRLFGTAFVTALFALHDPWTLKLILGLIVGAAEVAFRQFVAPK